MINDVVIGAQKLPLKIRLNKKAQRLILRINDDAGRDTLLVTVPVGVTDDYVLNWLKTQEQWILGRLQSRPARVLFTDGQTIPFRGDNVIIHHRQKLRGTVCMDGETVSVAGRPEHLSRRLTDWLKKQARQTILKCVAEKSQILDLNYGRITVRDTRSRWGSCSSNGNLSFCWRLILAPDYVLDYVVAHEVAHLQEHNHSSKFWAVTDQLTDHTIQAKQWLKSHGESLHRIG